MKYKLPYFPEIDTTEVAEYYDIEINGQKTSIDLNFSNKHVAISIFDKVKDFLENIEAQDAKNRGFIEADFRDEKGQAKEYLQFHLEELKDRLVGIIDFEDKTLDLEIQLMQKLKLVRIGFYPDGKYNSKNFVIYDYTIDRTITNELLVVNFDELGNFMYISWES